MHDSDEENIQELLQGRVSDVLSSEYTEKDKKKTKCERGRKKPHNKNSMLFVLGF